MTVSLEQLQNGIGRLLADGKEHLGVRVASHRKSLAGMLNGIREQRGSIVRGDRIEPWEIEGFLEHEGSIYAYGRPIDARPLSSELSLPGNEPWERLALLAKNAATLVRLGLPLPRPELSGILSVGAEGHLFLPDPILAAARAAATEEQRIAAAESWNHPDLSGERAFCYFLGALAYSVFTGRAPHTGSSEEEVHQRAREQSPISPRLDVPEITPEVAETVVRALSAHESFSLAEWERTLTDWSAHGVRREIGTEERRDLVEQAERLRRRSEVAFQRKSFLRRNWTTIAIITAAVIVVGFIGGSILKNALKPRITVGMSAEQVVHLYYTSMNGLNSQAMQDCVIDGAGRQTINQVETLFVINRVREGYGQGSFVPATLWKQEGEPPLSAGQSVFGVTGLAIHPAGPDEYLASYESWVSVPPKGAGEGPGPVLPLTVVGTERIDRLYLRDQGKFWAIYRIDTVKESPISSTK